MPRLPLCIRVCSTPLPQRGTQADEQCSGDCCASDKGRPVSKNEFLEADNLTWAVVPEYSGKHGHPIVIGREMITAFLNALPSSSARDVEHSLAQHIRYFPVDDPMVALNVDTPEDFTQLNSRIPS